MNKIKYLIAITMLVLFAFPAFSQYDYSLQDDHDYYADYDNAHSLVWTLDQKIKPDETVLYSLGGFEVLEVLNDGVLITGSYAVPIAFLYTKEQFVDRDSLNGFYAYLVGPYQYKTVQGAIATVYSFQMVNKTKAKTIIDKIIAPQIAADKIKAREAKIEAAKEAENEARIEAIKEADEARMASEEAARMALEEEEKRHEATKEAAYISINMGPEVISTIAGQTMQPATSYGIEYGLFDDYLTDFAAFGLCCNNGDYTDLEIYCRAGYRIIWNLFIDGGIGYQMQSTPGYDYSLTHQNGDAVAGATITYMGGINLMFYPFSIYADCHSTRNWIVGLSYAWYIPPKTL